MSLVKLSNVFTYSFVYNYREALKIFVTFVWISRHTRFVLRPVYTTRSKSERRTLSWRIVHYVYSQYTLYILSPKFGFVCDRQRDLHSSFVAKSKGSSPRQKRTANCNAKTVEILNNTLLFDTERSCLDHFGVRAMFGVRLRCVDRALRMTLIQSLITVVLIVVVY